jgi:hypothetical protein
MTPSHVSSPPTERPVVDVGVLRSGVLAFIALIVGSMFAYDLVRSSPRTPLPRPRPSAFAIAPALAAHPVGQLTSSYSPDSTR